MQTMPIRENAFPNTKPQIDLRFIYIYIKLNNSHQNQASIIIDCGYTFDSYNGSHPRSKSVTGTLSIISVYFTIKMLWCFDKNNSYAWNHTQPNLLRGGVWSADRNNKHVILTPPG